ncbi:MAG: carbon storage regulator CsrA [Firmicutes bacterium]|nr:carbon storage regulator CsrA [Bacillota bacterium]
MLALTRRKGESVILGNDIEVVVLNIQGDQVKLGFEAPKNITIHRKEIYDQIQAENLIASSAISIATLQQLKDSGQLPQKEE